MLYTLTPRPTNNAATHSFRARRYVLCVLRLLRTASGFGLRAATTICSLALFPELNLAGLGSG
eukprot:m.427506 g.427506  ORF g.427506 m.427506 type:complete len:63 (-) comp56700_c0_seq4:76-264(-)